MKYFGQVRGKRFLPFTEMSAMSPRSTGARQAFDGGYNNVRQKSYIHLVVLADASALFCWAVDSNLPQMSSV